MVSIIKAIRKKCLDCMGNNSFEVRACPCVKCPLWLFRFGKSPNAPTLKDSPFLNPKHFEDEELKDLESADFIKKVAQLPYWNRFKLKIEG